MEAADLTNINYSKLSKAVGRKTFNVTANDQAGNQSAVNLAYWIIYPFKSFFFKKEPPLPNLNVFVAGSVIPVTFSLGGDYGKNIFINGSPSVQSANGKVEELATGDLSYDAPSEEYVYVWKTKSSWGGSARLLRFKLSDGQEYQAVFVFSSTDRTGILIAVLFVVLVVGIAVWIYVRRANP